MLQIITYLGCVYLIFKGIEIYHTGDIANAETLEDRQRCQRRGGWMLIASIILAAVFAYWITVQAESVQPGFTP